MHEMKVIFSIKKLILKLTFALLQKVMSIYYYLRCWASISIWKPTTFQCVNLGVLISVSSNLGFHLHLQLSRIIRRCRRSHKSLLIQVMGLRRRRQIMGNEPLQEICSYRRLRRLQDRLLLRQCMALHTDLLFDMHLQQQSRAPE